MPSVRTSLLLIPFTLLCACQERESPDIEVVSTVPEKPPPPMMKKVVKKNTGAYTGQIIEKSSLNKAGKPMKTPDLFFRLSMGDYFIKFCESKVERSEIEEKLDQYITVKGTVKKGEWDICPGDSEKMQSRIGEYFVITEWVK